MIHLKRFNESVTKLYKAIDEGDLNACGIYIYSDEPVRLETISKIWVDFTQKELDIIKKYTPLKRGDIVCPVCQTDKSFIEIKSKDTNTYLSIVKIYDDCFFVTVGDLEDNHRLNPLGTEDDIYFKCDSIDGLEQLLKDYNWFRIIEESVEESLYMQITLEEYKELLCKSEFLSTNDKYTIDSFLKRYDYKGKSIVNGSPKYFKSEIVRRNNGDFRHSGSLKNDWVEFFHILTTFDNRTKLKIIKSDDGWFGVDISYTTHYKCDQLDGLIAFLTDYFD